MVLQDAEKGLEGSDIMVGIFKNRFRVISVLLQGISIGKSEPSPESLPQEGFTFVQTGLAF